jgi:hypothetical protein
MVVTADTTPAGAVVLFVVIPALGALVFVALVAWAVRIGTRPLVIELKGLRAELRAQQRSSHGS